MTSPLNEDANKSSDTPQSSNREDIPPEYLGSVLRAEIMPASEISPEKPGIRSLLNRLDMRYLAAFIAFFIVIAMSLVCFLGPGKPFLENSLLKLRNRYEDPTVTVRTSQFAQSTEATRTPSALLPTATTSQTPIPPTITSTIVPTVTPTEEDPCQNAVTVSLEDVGSTLCIKGTITGMEEREVGFIIYFSDQRGVFYLVTYDLVWDDAEEGDCIQITGEIQQLGNTPVMVFGWNNLPQMCP